MNLLFITLIDINSITERSIYTDLLREFINHGHEVFIVSPTERRNRVKTHIIEGNHCKILKLKTGNIQKTSIVEKGLSTLAIESQYIWGIKNHFKQERFDLVLYSTPPITLYKAVKYIKDRDKARTYLLLKDIFPQNAVDIGMMSKSGIKGGLYKLFRYKEKKLYDISDRIGCMSQANVDYILEHNPEVKGHQIEVCPNCVDPIDTSLTEEERISVRRKYELPLDKTIYVYGGNLGKPQGIEHFLNCIRTQIDNRELFFMIVGDGTEYSKVERFIDRYHPTNVALHRWIEKKDYDRVVAACDVGLIFLDHRFTIPNFPSRLLTYMQARRPVLAVTDERTDIGDVITGGGFGWWCRSDDVKEFQATITSIEPGEFREKGNAGFDFLRKEYSAQKCYYIINSNW